MPFHGRGATYTFVSNSPLTFVDPKGEIKWYGTVDSNDLSVGAGLGLDFYNLHTKCVNGEKGYVNFVGYGGDFSLNPLAWLKKLKGIMNVHPYGFSGSSIEFNDHLSSIDPNIFYGYYKRVAAGASVGVGYGVMTVQAGGASALFSPGVEAGFSLGIAGMFGHTHITSSSVVECGCK